jgi:predicted membrane protein
VETNRDRPQLDYRDGRPGARGPGLLTKVLAIAGSALVLAATIAISFVVFAIALAAIVVFGIYLWWKTRDLRKQMRAQAHDRSVIEGEVIRESRRDEIRSPAEDSRRQ